MIKTNVSISKERTLEKEKETLIKPQKFSYLVCFFHSFPSKVSESGR